MLPLSRINLALLCLFSTTFIWFAKILKHTERTRIFDKLAPEEYSTPPVEYPTSRFSPIITSINIFTALSGSYNSIIIVAHSLIVPKICHHFTDVTNEKQNNQYSDCLICYHASLRSLFLCQDWSNSRFSRGFEDHWHDL